MRETGDILIRPSKAEDRPSWEPLWEGYLRFYEADLPVGHADRLWKRICDPEDSIDCLVAEGARGEPVGFAHFFPHVDTWRDQSVCYLQDLYVASAYRGRGVGESLVKAVARRCEEEGWPVLYWQTARDNLQARRLYDKLAGGPTGFVVYELEQ